MRLIEVHVPVRTKLWPYRIVHGNGYTLFLYIGTSIFACRVKPMQSTILFTYNCVPIYKHNTARVYIYGYVLSNCVWRL